MLNLGTIHPEVMFEQKLPHNTILSTGGDPMSQSRSSVLLVNLVMLTSPEVGPNTHCRSGSLSTHIYFVGSRMATWVLGCSRARERDLVIAL